MFVFADHVSQFVGRRAAIAGATFLVVCSVVTGCRRPALTNQPNDHAVAHDADTTEQVASPGRNSLTQHFLATAMDDPSADGWDAEALNLKVSVQLKLIQQLLGSPDRSTANVAEQLATTDFRCKWLRPPNLKKVFTDGSLEVSHAVDGSHMTNADSGDRLAGPAALSDALMKLREPFSGRVRVETKVVGITRAEKDASTNVLFQAFGRGERGLVQQNARWTCQWTVGRDDKLPQLKHLAVENYDEVLVKDASATMIVDDTDAVMVADTAFDEQLRHGIDYWMRRVPTALGITAWGDHGLAIGDVNGDGRDDIYLCQPGGLPNLLYLAQADTTLKNISGDSKADWLDDTRSALLVDLDNDGDQDLVERGLVQQNARWTCQWTVGRDDKLPQLKHLAVENYDEVLVKDASATMIVDDTDAVMVADTAFDEQLRHGIDYWMRRVPTALGITAWGDHGLAIGDVNGDGRDDIYLCQPGGLPNLLYLAQADTTLKNISGDSKADWLDDTRSALLVDLDNDGDQDLVIGSREFLMLMENDGSGRFRLRADFRGARDAFSLSAADYDQDGNLDIYVCRYYSDGSQAGTNRARFSAPIPYHNATNGPPNVLLRNDGDWKFRDATEVTGMQQGNHRWSYAAAWEDYDNDGDQDIYVANDFGPNNLYRNDEGRFTETAADADALDASTGMSVDWADYNRDGWMDLYVGNMFSAAGYRVMSQLQFKSGENDQMRDRYRHLARGNTLLQNRHDSTFGDVTLSAKANMGRWAWSSNFVDLNNDGWEDLVVANGYYSGEKKDDL